MVLEKNEFCITFIEHWVAVVFKNCYSNAVANAGGVRLVHQDIGRLGM